MRSASISERAPAYGRARFCAVSARRIFAAATCFIALVICWVFFSDRIRSRRSRTEGMRSLRALVEFRQRGRELLFRLVGELTALRDRLGNLRMRRVEEVDQPGRPALQ